MIIKYRNSIEVKSNGREILEEELNKDGFVVNQGNIADYLLHKIDAHWHDELELFVLDSGEAEIELNGRCYHFCKGDGCFVNRDVLHAFESKHKEAKFRSFVFRSSFISGMAGSVFDLNYLYPLMNSGVPYAVFQSNLDHKIIRLFNEAFEACEKEEYGYEFHLRYLLSKILLHCAQIQRDSSSSDSMNERIKKMLIWIDEHLEEEITVTQIASASNLCVRECQRCFGQVLNLSPMEVVRQKRVVKAAHWLLATDMSVVEIACRLHFSNSSHFSKVFKEKVGCTPIQYRKKNQGKIESRGNSI